MTESRVLIVEDELQLLRVLAQILRQRLENSRIDTCDSPAAALEMIRSTEYDAILSDIRLPGTDGLTLLRAIRDLRPDTPTLLMTAHTEHELAVEALRAGAFDYLEKPIDINYLVASLTRAFRARAIDRALDDKRAALERHAEELAHIVEDQTRQLREANRLKDEFLATLSHELRTPLTAILGWARLMVRGRLDEQTGVQAITAIERNATLQARLIDDLLDVSRIMTGKLRLAKRRVQLAPLISNAVDTAASDARTRGVRIERCIDTSTGDVYGDPDRLQQIALNLVANAIKFSPDSSVVTVTLARSGSQAVLTVRDRGDGISPEFLPKVFDRFRQADTSLSRSRGGLGLGLAIVHYLVEAHEGRVVAESAGRDQGATFSVHLPLMAEESDALEQPPTGRAAADPSLQGVCVLVVEDEQDTRAMVQVALEKFGARVIAVSSAAQAVDAIERTHPDVLVCDIAMPHEDGYSLIRRLRARGDVGAARIPAAALTAHARAEDVRHALSEGFDVHLAKPVEPAVVAAAVAHLAELRRFGAAAM